jgi:hypothetical protein
MSITTDLTTDLGRMPGSFMIGRGTAFNYKNKQVDLKMLGNELAIRWAVQGAVQRSGDHVRVNVSLTDLSTSGDFWSDRFDGDRSNLADLQDHLPPGGGRYHFFEFRSFSIALSSIASASSFLSPAFSSSSDFNRRASDTSRPPYLSPGARLRVRTGEVPTGAGTHPRARRSPVASRGND